jgi:hypothetical protein
MHFIRVLFVVSYPGFTAIANIIPRRPTSRDLRQFRMRPLRQTEQILSTFFGSLKFGIDEFPRVEMPGHFKISLVRDLYHVFWAERSNMAVGSL